MTKPALSVADRELGVIFKTLGEIAQSGMSDPAKLSVMATFLAYSELAVSARQRAGA